MWNRFLQFAARFVVPVVIATATHALTRLVIDDFVEQRKAARDLRNAQPRKTAVRAKKPAAKRRRKVAK
jgi:hypothetical protein